MSGFGWEKFAANTPYMTKEIGSMGLNTVLKYFLANSLLLTFGVILYGVRKIFAFKNP
jgi:hypothetical protein